MEGSTYYLTEKRTDKRERIYTFTYHFKISYNLSKGVVFILIICPCIVFEQIIFIRKAFIVKGADHQPLREGLRSDHDDLIYIVLPGVSSFFA